MNLIALLLYVSAFCAISSHSSQLQEYGFSNGKMMGWTNIRDPSFRAVTSKEFGDLDELNTAVCVGDFDIRDRQHPSRILRSPEFHISQDSEISVFLLGGTGDASAPPSHSSQVSNQTDSHGYLGVALRRVSDDRYVLWGRRTKRGTKLNWQEVRWSPEELRTYSSPREAYTLDLIDSYHGGWGWTCMDDVLLPAPITPLRSEETAGVPFPFTSTTSPQGKSSDPSSQSVQTRRVCTKVVRDFRREAAAVVAVAAIVLGVAAFWGLKKFL